MEPRVGTPGPESRAPGPESRAVCYQKPGVTPLKATLQWLLCKPPPSSHPALPGSGPGNLNLSYLIQNSFSSVDSLWERDSSLDQSTCLLQLLYTLSTELPPEGVAHARSPAV